MNKVLEINGLLVSLAHGQKRVDILRGVNLSVARHEVVALVGESGCGKTLTALSAMKLLPAAACLDGGTIRLDGRDVAPLTEKEMESVRGKTAGMIFQEPSSYLNPVFTAGDQVEEALPGSLPAAERRDRVLRMFREVGLKDIHYRQYPHQLSGGMQQRVLIAMALVNNAPLLIADEPTTALDVTTAAQIIALLRKLMEAHGLGVLFISHDIALARSFADTVAVMYAGKVVETSGAAALFSHPAHPYTEALIACLPEQYSRGADIPVIKGTVPEFAELPTGCPFHPRCRYRMPLCAEQKPGEIRAGNTIVRCFKYGNTVED